MLYRILEAILCAVFFVALLFLAAVGGQALPAAQAADDEAARLPDGPGKDVFLKVCNQCHGVDNVRRFRRTKAEWSDAVGDMIERGAEATDQEVTVIAAYLEQNFGPKSKVRINSAPLTELKSVVGLTVEESKAVVAYREANGNFKQWSDLLKVPGVDPKKLEAKKDLIVF